MNRTMKIIVSIVLCVWIFAMGIELGAYRERRAINVTLSSAGNTQQTVQSTTTTQAPQTTQPPQTTAPTTTTTSAPVVGNNDVTTTAPTTESTSALAAEAKLPTTNEEIAKAYNDAINATKNTTKSFTATQVENVTMNIVDSSIPSMLEGAVSSIMQGLMGEETYTYSNADMAGFKENFPPPGREAALPAEGIKSATSEPYGDGGYKLTITLVEETATYDVLPPYHSASVGYLDLDSLGLPVTIQSADFQYSGATVTICVNGEGLIDSYDVDFPMAGSGTGKAMGLTATLTIEGGLDETWDIAWQ